MCVLEFSVSYMHQQPGSISIEGGWLSIQPHNGAIDPGKSIDLSIRYFSRMLGEFTVFFLMEVLLIFVHKIQ